MLNINIQTPSSMMQELKMKFKQRRLSFDLTQEGLSKRSGVALGSLKRFESSGQISLESLLKLALVLECIDDFNTIPNVKNTLPNTLDAIIKEKKKPAKKRGSIK